MSDSTAPILKRLVLPATIDLSKGAVSFEALVEALDEEGGSGIAMVSVWLDRRMALDPFRTEILQFSSYDKDNFSDATPSVASASFTVLPTTASGAYAIKQVWVRDRAGNTSIYDSQQLQALGIGTSLNVTGGIVDTTVPTLTGLTLPASIDLSRGAASLKAIVAASDNPGGTGIEFAMLHFDKPLVTNDLTSQFLSVGIVGIDSFEDATPGTAASEYSILPTTNPGTYELRGLTLRDRAGNETQYTAAQLHALGIGTTMQVTGSAADTAGPSLIDLYLPSVIPLQAQPRQIAAAVAVDAAGGSGVAEVFVAFDRDIQFKEFSARGIVIGGAGSADTFQDLTSVYGTGGFTLTDATVPGVYKVQGVIVRDLAGNSTHYSAEQLQQRGINTSMSIVEGGATATAAVSASSGRLHLALGSSQWNGQVADAFELRLKFNPQQMQFGSITAGGAQGSALNSKVFVAADDVAYLTVTGMSLLARDAVLQLAMDVVGGAGLVHYAIDSFTVNGKAQLFGDGRAGTVMLGDAAANRFLDANTATVIDGQGGIDHVILSGLVNQYQVRKSGDGFVVENFGDTRVILHNVERIAVGRDWIALDVDGVAGQVYRLYQAAFGRAPDKPGIGYWLGQSDKGVSLHAIAREFSASAEFQRAVKGNPSAEAFVGALYENVLHRAPDQAGFQFWVDTLKATSDHAAVLLSFSESAENVAQVVGAIENGFGYWV